MNEEIQTTRDSNIIQAIGEQSEIGWIHLFLGRMSKKWAISQLLYLKQNTHLLDNTKSKKYIIEQQHQRWINFFKSLINYRLDLWEARNTHLHGTTPQNQRYIRRKKAIQIATDLYNQGKITVPHNQERLFHNFNQRIEGRT